MLPPEIERIIAQPVSAALEEAIAGGKRAIGFTCSYVPEPLLAVEGLVPVRVRAPGAAGTEMADTYLSSVICSYTRSLLEFALDGRYDALSGWVFTASCDHLRRLYDNLEYLLKPPFNHIIDLPHKLSDEALGWYVEELDVLAKRLAGEFGVDTGADALNESIARHNRYLETMRAIGETRKEDPAPISGAEFLSILLAGSAAPKDLLTPVLDDVRAQLDAGNGDRPRTRARLMLAGGLLDDPEYVRVIEQTGGAVVADRTCVGSMPGLDPIEMTGDPIRDLAVHTLRKTSCPRMMEEFDSRTEAILAAAREYRVDGVVLQSMKFCDTWGVEGSPLADAVRGAGVPVLRLERDYRLTGEGQLRTRVQAFLESIGK